ncbi:sigma 54-interacting response regulator [Flavobacterium taihuense]|uniref:Sigma 54-interacting transcriptional regulator n=1 Tax=Flavobacterium taihuense TaxID=2857508 RepID=A0ABS6XZA0_9FLAO|nr:sigma 54-interacting response regulator [Flavobacterium taihuense]MBW4361606.1 sigma 54-interacting transcriptional regulator [Flavobacterium taihuense]
MNVAFNDESIKLSPNLKKKILIVEDQFIEAHDLQLILEKANYEVMGIMRSVAQVLEFIEIEMPDLVFVDIFLKGKETGIDLAKILKEKHIGFIYLSANSSKSILEEAKKTQPYGFIVKPFRDQDVLITLDIACFRHENGLETQMLQEKILEKNINEITFSSLKWEQALLQLGKTLQTYIPFDYMEARFINDFSNSIGLLRRNFDNYEMINIDKFSKILNFKKEELIDLYTRSLKLETARIYQGDSFAKVNQDSAIKRLVLHTFGIKTFIILPLIVEDGIFNFLFYSRSYDIYVEEHLTLLMKLQNVLTKFVSEMYITDKKLDGKEKIIFNVPKNSRQGFESMIGNSKKMIAVFDSIQRVAPFETSVLILGESGTGKEKVAQSIHSLSSRKDKPLVIINCTTIPENLAESLLFGHEKGAFTGAADKRIGKFEMADGGTIFLDEIGEMPIDLQVKLLRVLQEKEIERVGGRSPIKIDVRIIAATNRNLEEEVAAGRFRLDLYYRLYVFPILIPALRERTEDIPILASHFINLFSEKTGLKAPLLHETVLQQLQFYEWPGNIRELEHVIERSILMSDGNVIKEIQLPFAKKHDGEEKQQEFTIKSIHDNERDYIIYILKRCKGKISGMGGAAEILNIPSSTLNSKIKKLGIKIKHFL